MSKEIELVKVTISVPKPMIESIRERPWFQYCHNIEDFIVDAIRKVTENWDVVTRNE